MGEQADGQKYLEREFNSSRSPIVRYLPTPDVSTAGFNQGSSSEWIARWVPSDLPSVCIEDYNASCNICLMDFEEPPLQSPTNLKPGPDVTEIEPLRQLACRHVFHQLCIDTYLDSIESDQYLCPMCHNDVITLASYLEQWQADFYQLMSEQSDYDIQESEGDIQETRFKDGTEEFDKDGLLVESEYTFEVNNKYLGCRMSSNRSLLDEAKLLLERNGTLSEVALLIEAAIQEGDLGEGGYEAWILLGQTRYSDVRDEGIYALTAGVRRALALGITAGMVLLAASYVTESYHQACRVVLVRWLQMRLPTMLISQKTRKAILMHPFNHANVQEVVDLFLHVARAEYNDNVVDPDIHLALGILFHINEDLYNATVCYASVLAAQPTDYYLYCLICLSIEGFNGVIPLCEEALRLYPVYTRAHIYKASAYYKADAHKEAVECLLTALALQESGNGKAPELLWSALHDIFGEMNREDLAAISTVEAQTSLNVYRREGFQFMDVTAFALDVTAN